MFATATVLRGSALTLDSEGSLSYRKLKPIRHVGPFRRPKQLLLGVHVGGFPTLFLGMLGPPQLRGLVSWSEFKVAVLWGRDVGLLDTIDTAQRKSNQHPDCKSSLPRHLVLWISYSTL